MRPADVAFSTSPDMDPGLHALRAELRGGGRTAPADVLGLVTALHELEAICSSMLSGRGGPNKPNRASLHADLGAALGELGSQLHRAGGVRLANFQAELSQLLSVSKRAKVPE